MSNSHPRRRCSECGGWFRPAASALKTQQTCRDDYTVAAYRINDATRARLRQERRTAILGALQRLRDLAMVQRQIRDAVTELARAGRPSNAEELRTAEGTLREFRARVIDVLRRFAVVPEGAPSVCRCRSEALPGRGLIRGQAITALTAR